MPLANLPYHDLTGPLVRGVGEGGVLSLPQIAPMVTVAAGNSISANSKWDSPSGRWSAAAELHIANMLCGSPMRFKRITASTRSDRYGVYGYSGARLDTINADIADQWIAPLASVTPNLAVGLALLENDIIQGSTVADMTARLTAWISAVQTAWPAARILLCTPRPSTSYNTGTLVANYQAIRDYMLSLDNLSSIVVARLDDYEDPATPANPLAGYTLDGLHPNPRGALVNGRRIATTLRRLGRPTREAAIVSSNRTMTGSVAATGTNVTGTRPTNCGSNGIAGSTIVSLAENPGWKVTITNTSGAALVLDNIVNCPAEAIAGAPTYISPYCVVRIVSGAENLRGICLQPRILDGSGNTFQLYMRVNSGDSDADYQNGDVLTWVVPPLAATSGSITQLTNYLSPILKNTTNPAVIEVVETGYMVIT